MSKQAQHTPGPWRTGDRFNTVFGPPNGEPAPEVIATVNRGNVANARLIAAAPELLAALKTAVMAYHQIPGTLYRKEPDWHKQANIVIAVAEEPDAN